MSALRVPAGCQWDANVLGFLGFLGVTSMIHRKVRRMRYLLVDMYNSGNFYANSYSQVASILYSEDLHGKAIRNAG